MDFDLIDIVTNLLDAPLRPEGFHDVSDALATRFDAISAAVLVTDPAHAERSIPFASQFLREDTAGIRAQYLAGKDDDDAAAYMILMQKPRGKLFSEREIYGAAAGDMPPSSFRTFIFENAGIRHRWAMHLNAYVDRSDILTFQLPDRNPALSSEDVRIIERLSPLIAKSLRLHRVFDALHARFGAMLGALDRLGLGVLLLAEEGEIILSNSAADMVLEAHDGLSCDRARRLRADDPAASMALASAIAATWATARRQGWTADRLVAVARRSGAAPYLMTLGPLVDGAGEFERGFGCAIAFIVDPGGATPLSVEGLRFAGGLTEAETAVCALLVEGLAPAEIAARRGVSPLTVKAQTRAIMGKLRCGTRADLVRLAAMTRLPLGPR